MTSGFCVKYEKVALFSRDQILKDRVVWPRLDFDWGVGTENNVYAVPWWNAKLPQCEKKCVESKTVLISESLFKTRDRQAPMRE